MDVFAIQNLNFTYPEQDTPVLRNLSLTVRPGDFLVLAGPSGCGKSTLLRQLKTILAPHGKLDGSVSFQGTPLQDVPLAEQATRIGFVLQDPESQIVTDKVWHELAFGLESLGYDTPTIRGAVAEMASFFGIQNWFHLEVTQLSGGQKQLLNLAAVMVLHPDVLILDEPTSQLDPIAATDFLQTLYRINRELGTTILITEHRLEEVLPLANRLVILDSGEILADDAPTAVFHVLRQQNHPMLAAMPAPMQIWSAVPSSLPCPLTVSEGRDFLTQWAQDNALKPVPSRPEFVPTAQACIHMEDVWFRYEKDGPDILRGLTLTAHPGELLCILGGNGTGKSTTLSILSGLRNPYRGKVAVHGRVASLPQDPRMVLVKKNLRTDLLAAFPGKTLEEVAEPLGKMVALCRLEGLLDRHPYDLSGGEQQRAALAKILLQQPDILLLDEPTKGLDGHFKGILAHVLQNLAAQGKCIILVSHDVEFCAAYAHRCGLFFDGSVVSQAPPQPFFSGKRFYTTAANRMARHLIPNAVTAGEVIAACGGLLPPEPEPAPPETPTDLHPPAEQQVRKLPLWRKLLALLSGLSALALLAFSALRLDLSQLYSDGQFIRRYGWVYLLMFLSIGVFAATMNRRSPVVQQRLFRGKLPKRTKVCLALCLLAIPVTIALGLYCFGGRRYMGISMLVLLETLLPFFLIFEGRKPQARELVILAVLSALAIGGRAIFFALPGFKPVAAMVILSGVAFGGEAGFMVGAVTMLCSNVLYAQGPWTPWQMFAMGLIGLLAGVLFRKGLLYRSRVSLTIFGALAVFLVYGGIMNPASVLMYQSDVSWSRILAAYVTGVPADVVHGLATGLFLWFFSEPMLEKLDRVKVKYGLLEARQSPGVSITK